MPFDAVSTFGPAGSRFSQMGTGAVTVAVPTVAPCEVDDVGGRYAIGVVSGLGVEVGVGAERGVAVRVSRLVGVGGGRGVDLPPKNWSTLNVRIWTAKGGGHGGSTTHAGADHQQAP